MTDYATRRTMMVDTQIRPSDVTKFPIIDSMRSVPRENFVPRDLREAAYVGENMPLDRGRVILEPRTFAKMLDALDVQQNELVLDIGSGFGYSAVVLARLAEAVVALEDSSERCQESQEALAEFGADNVICQNGALDAGAPEHGPYDVIVIEGAVDQIPQTIIDQLKNGGRIIALFADGAFGRVMMGYKLDGKVDWRNVFDAGAPVLPGFQKQHTFAL